MHRYLEPLSAQAPCSYLCFLPSRAQECSSEASFYFFQRPAREGEKHCKNSHLCFAVFFCSFSYFLYLPLKKKLSPVGGSHKSHTRQWKVKFVCAAKQPRSESTDTGILYEVMLMAGEECSISSHICVLVDLPSFDILNKDSDSSKTLLELLLERWILFNYFNLGSLGRSR